MIYLINTGTKIVKTTFRKINDKHYIYVAFYRFDSKLHSKLGIVKQKNDGRWEYIVIIPKINFYQNHWNTRIQGVCKTEDKAKLNILNNWKNVKKRMYLNADI